MSLQQTLKRVLLPLLVLLISQLSFSQGRTVSGKVTDSKDGAPVVGATVAAKGSTRGTSTTIAGDFSLTVPAGVNTLVISSVGFTSLEVDISGKTSVAISLVSTGGASLNEIVVTGYSTTRRRDLTGSVASVQSKDFNKGPVTNPDQLLQGKVAGLQIINTSGQPGAATIVKIRGNSSIRSGNTPLYVIDGVPLDGRSARPGFNANGLGQTPDANPLIYINPADILQIDVLKDASASAIYGSRGANGVILITTRKGQVGPARVDAGASVGFSGVMRKIDVLDAGAYRSALQTYSAPNTDSGKSIDPFDAILNKGAPTQNYTVAFGAGTDNGRYRASFLWNDQQGIIRKTSLRKYVGNFNGQYKFLDKRLSFDFNITAANVSERIAPVSNDAGSDGNIISLALIWNPTLELTRSNGRYNQENPSGQLNPLSFSDAYNDNTNITTILASATAAYKITKDLEYRLLFGINYSTGLRKAEILGWANIKGDEDGIAAVLNNQLMSRTITHTLVYNKKITTNLSLNALIGYEYWLTRYQGNGVGATKFDLQQDQLNQTPNYHYYDNMQAGDPTKLSTFSFKDPQVELQSYFARAVLNYQDKYLITATFRADGSSKFGKNNRYAYFPSVAAAWTISNEEFMKNSTLFNTLKVRLGWGQTGNQEFNPVDAALQTATYNSFSNLGVNHYGNDDLKWETVSSYDAGLDFAIMKGRVYGYIDYFSKETKDPILDFVISQPTAGGGTVFKNMDGKQAKKATVTNKGVEVSIGADIVKNENFTWSVGANATFVKNKFKSPELSIVPFIKNTGGLHGQGTSGAYSQVIADGQPIDVFFIPTFLGFDKNTGIATYSGTSEFNGDPNPTTYLGFSTDLTFKKWTLGLNMHGSFGNLIYNNTAMSVLNISNIIGGRNIASNLIGNGENVANAITPSSRYLEKGDYMKLGNATISYNIGKIGNYVKSASVYISGYNLFVISKYNGFDPEVNVDKALNGVPSLGVDYIGFPSSRTVQVGVNFSL